MESGGNVAQAAASPEGTGGQAVGVAVVVVRERCWMKSFGTASGHRRSLDPSVGILHEVPAS